MPVTPLSAHQARAPQPYPLRVDLGRQGRIELSEYDRPVAVAPPPGALKAR